MGPRWLRVCSCLYVHCVSSFILRVSPPPAPLPGDAILLRIRHHILPLGLHCPEELNKNSGASQGAVDLTWSYGTVFGAMDGRAAAMSAIQAAMA